MNLAAYKPGFGSYRENGGLSSRGKHNLFGALFVVLILTYFDLWSHLPIPRSVHSEIRSNLQGLAERGLVKPDESHMPAGEVVVRGAESDFQNILGHRLQRRSCPHWQNIGCLGDVVEKLCEAKGPRDGGELLNPAVRESLWMCCCPRAYAPCTMSERNAVCDTALQKSLQRIGKRPLTADLIVAVLAARQTLRQADSQCARTLSAGDSVAITGPQAGAKVYCGAKAVPPLKRSIAHPGVFCETVTWQWEELGDGDENEFKANDCPVPDVTLKDNSSRKGTVLKDIAGPLAGMQKKYG